MQAKGGAAPKKMEIEKKKANVPSNVEKRRARDAKDADARKTRRAGARKTAGDKKKEYATRAEKHAAERRTLAK